MEATSAGSKGMENSNNYKVELKAHIVKVAEFVLASQFAEYFATSYDKDVFMAAAKGCSNELTAVFAKTYSQDSLVMCTVRYRVITDSDHSYETREDGSVWMINTLEASFNINKMNVDIADVKNAMEFLNSAAALACEIQEKFSKTVSVCIRTADEEKEQREFNQAHNFKLAIDKALDEARKGMRKGSTKKIKIQCSELLEKPSIHNLVRYDHNGTHEYTVHVHGKSGNIDIVRTS